MFAAQQLPGSMKLAKFSIPILAALMLVGTTAAPSAAEDLTAEWEWSSLSATKTDPWRFSVNVYGWLPSAPVDIKTEEGESESAPESFDNIFDSLQLAGMAEAEIHKGPIGVFVSPIFYKGEDDEHFTGPLGASRKATLKETAWLIKYGVSYDLGLFRLGESSDPPTVTLQPYAGGLYFHDKIRLDLSPGAIGPGVNVRETIEFNTPIIGVNTLWDLTDRWSLRIGGNIGGWHVDDVNQTYEIIGTAAYHFKLWDKSAKVFAGYRYLHLDYEKEVELEVTIKGPLFGFGFEF
jgi:hypothetical protein